MTTGQGMTHDPSLACINHRTFVLFEGGGMSCLDGRGERKGRENIDTCFLPYLLGIAGPLGREGLGKEAKKYIFRRDFEGCVGGEKGKSEA